MSKQCSNCQLILPKSRFSKQKSSKDGLQCYCKTCASAKVRALYASSESYRASSKVRARERRDENRKKALEYLSSHPCVDCPESNPIVLEFDHRDGKSFNISDALRSSRPWLTIENEISKCDVRCANCHKRATARKFGSYRDPNFIPKHLK